MQNLKKVLSLTLVTAIMAANTNVENVIASNISVEKVISSESAATEDADFVIEDNVLVKYNGNDTEVVIPDGVTSIGDYAFYDCSNLSSIVIPDSVTSIEPYTFEECSSLSSVVIPDNVTSIGGCAFNKCSGLNSIVLPDNITSIDYCAFEKCSNLSSIRIPDSVTSIGNSTFNKCSSLTSITIPESVTSIEWNISKWDAVSRNELINNLTFYCPKGSYAETYALTYDIQYKYISDDITETTPSQPTVSETPSAPPTQKPMVSTQQKSQIITAKNFTKTYGNKAFHIGATTNGDGKLTFTSGNKKIVTVSKNGKVTSKGCGKTTITIKATETTEYKAAKKKITITVKPKKASLRSVKSTKSKTITVKWKKRQKG